MIRRLPARATPTLDVGCSAETEPSRERMPAPDRTPFEANVEVGTIPVEAHF
jgi:hypothetical protein